MAVLFSQKGSSERRPRTAAVTQEKRLSTSGGIVPLLGGIKAKSIITRGDKVVGHLQPSQFEYTTAALFFLRQYHFCHVFSQPQHTNVCFWYLPPGIRYMEDKEERKKRLHKVSVGPHTIKALGETNTAALRCHESTTCVNIVLEHRNRKVSFVFKFCTNAQRGKFGSDRLSKPRCHILLEKNASISSQRLEN